MLNSYIDLQAAMFATLSSSYLDRPPFWSPEEFVLNRDIQLTLPKKNPAIILFNVQDLNHLHNMYCKLIPVFQEAWELAINTYYASLTAAERTSRGLVTEGRAVKFVAFVDEAKGPQTAYHAWYKMWKLCRKDLEGLIGEAPSSEVHAMVAEVGISSLARQHDFVEVGPVRFTSGIRDGDWAMARPPLVMQNAEGEMLAQPEFGRVQGVFEHEGPDGKTEVVVRMQWFQGVPEGQELYHPEMRIPMISKLVRRDDIDVMWLAKDLIPLRCWAARDWDVAARQVMLARTWSVLRVLGFPVQPYPDHPYHYLP